MKKVIDSYKSLFIFINLVLKVFLDFDGILNVSFFFGDIKVRYFRLK